jgi:hypothetical protein
MTDAATQVVIDPRQHDEAESSRKLHWHIDTMHRIAGDKQDRAAQGRWRMTHSLTSAAQASSRPWPTLARPCAACASRPRRPSYCQKQGDVERAARNAARALREAARYAKRLLPGEVFRVHDRISGERIETVAACKEVLRREVELRDYYGRGVHPSHAAYAKAAELAKRVLLARQERTPSAGATQAEIDKITANAIKRNRKDGARI